MSNRPIIGVTVGTPTNPNIIGGATAEQIKQIEENTKKYVDEAIKDIEIPESGGTSDYTELTNKPKINGVELDGDLTLEQLGLNVGGDGATFTTLWRGKAGNGTKIDLLDSVLNYEQIIIIACISGNPVYQISGIFSTKDLLANNMADIMNVQQVYLGTPFEVNTGNGTITAICNAVCDIIGLTEIRFRSNVTIKWNSASMLAVIGVK